MKIFKYMCLAMVASATSLLAFGNSQVDQQTLYSDDSDVVATDPKSDDAEKYQRSNVDDDADVNDNNGNRGNYYRDARRGNFHRQNGVGRGHWGGGCQGGGCGYEASYGCGCGSCGDNWGGGYGYGNGYGHGRHHQRWYSDSSNYNQPRFRERQTAFQPGVSNQTRQQQYQSRSQTQNQNQFQSRNQNQTQNQRDRSIALNDDQQLGHPTQARSSTDESLANTIRTAFQSDTTFSPLVRVVEIRTQNGEVTLVGFVSSEDEKARLEALTKRINGVSTINNNLQVKDQN